MCEPVKPVQKRHLQAKDFCLFSLLWFGILKGFFLYIVELYHSHLLHCRTSQATELISVCLLSLIYFQYIFLLPELPHCTRLKHSTLLLKKYKN